MEKKISNAFTYMFKDAQWKYKLLVLTLLSVPSVYQSYLKDIKHVKEPQLILLLLVIITSILMSGYISKCIQNIIYSNAENAPMLPAWEDDFGGYFIIGLKKILAGILILIALIPGTLLIIPLLVFIFLTIALERIFCERFDITSYYAWKKAFNLIKLNPTKYIQIILMYIPLVLALGLITLLFFNTPFILVILPVVATYYALVSAYLKGIVGSESEVKIDDVVIES